MLQQQNAGPQVLLFKQSDSTSAQTVSEIFRTVIQAYQQLFRLDVGSKM